MGREEKQTTLSCRFDGTSQLSTYNILEGGVIVRSEVEGGNSVQSISTLIAASVLTEILDVVNIQGITRIFEHSNIVLSEHLIIIRGLYFNMTDIQARKELFI